MNLFVRIAVIGLLAQAFLSLNAQRQKPPLPRVVSAAAPFYPRLAPPARIQGEVTLCLSTDGTRVSSIDAASGPPMLVRTAKENVRTWQFERHAPTTFEAVFRYRLFGYKCEAGCKCESEEKESVILRLPAEVELSAVIPMICDPVEDTRNLAASPGAQDKPPEIKRELPMPVNASVPFYPPLARQTHIEGVVALRVTTDGEKVSAVSVENGHPLLAGAATESVKTLTFERHVATTFQTTFRYRLLASKCDKECNCEPEEKESVLLRLPAYVEVSAAALMLCDPVEVIKKRK